MVEHCRDSGHKLCDCGGYHYKHRPGSPLCRQNPMSAVHAAMRDAACSAEDLLEIEMECAVHVPGRPMRAWPDDYRRHPAA